MNERKITRRIILEQGQLLPFEKDVEGKSFWDTGSWPARWIQPGRVLPAAWVAAFRRRFEVSKPLKLKLHVSADERYILFLNGKYVGQTNEQGDFSNWFYDTYELCLEPGRHCLVARVQHLGPHRGSARISVRPGFLVAAESVPDALLNTGVAKWDYLFLESYTVIPDPSIPFDGFTPRRIQFDASKHPWGYEEGSGSGWKKAVPDSGPANFPHPIRGAGSHLLRPSGLPDMRREPRKGWQVRHAEILEPDCEVHRHPIESRNHNPSVAADFANLLDGGPPVCLGKRQTLRIILDLKGYTCSLPRLKVSGGKGSEVRLSWAESLFEKPGTAAAIDKGNRNAIEGKFFKGKTDTFLCDGGAGRIMEPLWWQAGRYVELVIQVELTLVIEDLSFIETGYPLKEESHFDCDHTGVQAFKTLALASLKANAHDLYFDCPYYEQLGYAGDSLIQALCGYSLTHDSRLAARAVELYAWSLLPDGFTQSRYPCREYQVTPPFCLHWIGMIYNHFLWRKDETLIRRVWPVGRRVLDAFVERLADDLIPGNLPGWCFIDWVPEWDNGRPPRDGQKPGGPMNALWLLALSQAEWIEQQLGEFELALRWRRLLKRSGDAFEKTFWCSAKGLYSDLPGNDESFCEHTQALVILSGHCTPDRLHSLAGKLAQRKDLTCATLYFSHHVFEALQTAGMGEAIWKQLDRWWILSKSGFVTTPERHEPCRSDCHAWTAHPLFHLFATVAGIRPTAPGASTLSISPAPGPLQHFQLRLPLPGGFLEFQASLTDGQWEGSLSLPSSVLVDFPAAGIEEGSGTMDVRWSENIPHHLHR